MENLNSYNALIKKNYIISVSNEIITNKFYHFVAITISSVSLLLFLLISFDNRYKGIYLYIQYIPLIYSMLNLTFSKVYCNLTIGRIIVLALMFIRYCFTPYTIFKDGYPSGIYYIVNSDGTALYSTSLMCYEMVVLFIVLIYISKNNKSKNEKVARGSIVNKYNFSCINTFVKAIILITIVIYTIYPTLFSNYHFILNSGGTDLTEIVSFQSGLPFGMRWIGYTFGELTRYVLVGWIILRLFKRSEKVGHKKFYCFGSLLIILINMVFLTYRQMLCMAMSASFCILVLKLYPKERNNLYRLFTISGIVIAVLLVFNYWEKSLTYHSFSVMLQGYTNGYYSVYQNYSAYQAFSQDLAEKIVMFIFGDTLMSINIINIFIQKYFTFMTSSNIYNYYLYGTEFNGGAVVTMLSECNYYLSFLLAPIGSAISLLLMERYENKAVAKGSCFVALKFMSLIFALAPFMYNYTTVIHIYTLMYLPLFITSKLNCISFNK